MTATDLTSAPMDAEDYPETAAGTAPGAGGAETEVVKVPSKPTPKGKAAVTGDIPAAVVSELAWSQCDDETQPVARAPWLDVLERASYIAMVGVAIAVIVGIAGWFLMHRNDASGLNEEPTSTPQTIPASVLPAPSTESPTPVAPPPPPPPQTVTVHEAPPPPPQTVTVEASPAPSRDDEFIQRLEADELVLHNRAQALQAAHWVCAQLAAGRTQADIVASSEPNNPTVTHLGMVDFVSAAADFYCPQYAGN